MLPVGTVCPDQTQPFPCLAANDDTAGCGTGLQSRVSFYASPGDKYAILVTGYSTSAGTYNVSWSYDLISPTPTPTPSRTPNFRPTCYAGRPGLSGQWTGSTRRSLDVGFGGSCNGVNYGSLTGEKLILVTVPSGAPPGGQLTVHTCAGSTFGECGGGALGERVAALEEGGRAYFVAHLPCGLLQGAPPMWHPGLASDSARSRNSLTHSPCQAGLAHRPPHLTLASPITSHPPSHPTPHPSTTDTEIIVSAPLLGGACPANEAAFQCAYSNDDSSACGAGNGVGSLVSFPATPGATYGVLVAGYGTSEGEFTLTWTYGFPSPSPTPNLPTPPPCLAQGLLASNATKSFTGSTTGRRGSWGGTCGGVGYGSAAGQAMVTVVIPDDAPMGGTLYLDTCNGAGGPGGFDTQIILSGSMDNAAAAYACPTSMSQVSRTGGEAAACGREGQGAEGASDAAWLPHIRVASPRSPDTTRHISSPHATLPPSPPLAVLVLRGVE